MEKAKKAWVAYNLGSRGRYRQKKPMKVGETSRRDKTFIALEFAACFVRSY